MDLNSLGYAHRMQGSGPSVSLLYPGGRYRVAVSCTPSFRSYLGHSGGSGQYEHGRLGGRQQQAGCRARFNRCLTTLEMLLTLKWVFNVHYIRIQNNNFIASGPRCNFGQIIQVKPALDLNLSSHLMISFCRSRMLGYGCGNLDSRVSVGSSPAAAPKLSMLYCGGSDGSSRVISNRRPLKLMGPGSRA